MEKNSFYATRGWAQLISGKIDEGFLDDLMGGRINEYYWDQK